MSEATVEIVNNYGFHIRPATKFLEIATSYSSEVEVSAKGVTVDGCSVMGLISLGVMQGEKITITCSGEDEEVALQALVDLVKSSFGGIA